MDRTPLPAVVAVAGDPGGASAVAPVIEILQGEGRVRVQALAYRQARAVWAKRSLPYEEIPEDMTRAAMAERLRHSEAALLLTGTSVNPVELEKQFVAASRETRAPSLAILDFWTNYARRFSDAAGRLAYVPDRIAVMDERARDEMTAAGLDPARLVVTGQPALDDLAAWKSRFTPARRQAIRDAFSVSPGEMFVLFASQPLSALYGTDPANPLYPGFDEQTVLRTLVAALDQIAEERHRNIVLVVRPHPRESVESLSHMQCRAVRLVVSAEGEGRELVMAADLVTGMNTMLLLEACYLGCVTVSLQPGLRSLDPLPTNLWGFSRGVYSEAEIKPVVEQMLLDAQTMAAVQTRLSHLQLDGGATRRVAELAYQMIGLE